MDIDSGLFIPYHKWSPLYAVIPVTTAFDNHSIELTNYMSLNIISKINDIDKKLLW